MKERPHGQERFLGIAPGPVPTMISGDGRKGSKRGLMKSSTSRNYHRCLVCGRVVGVEWVCIVQSGTRAMAFNWLVEAVIVGMCPLACLEKEGLGNACRRVCVGALNEGGVGVPASQRSLVSFSAAFAGPVRLPL